METRSKVLEEEVCCFQTCISRAPTPAMRSAKTARAARSRFIAFLLSLTDFLEFSSAENIVSAQGRLAFMSQQPRIMSPYSYVGE